MLPTPWVNCQKVSRYRLSSRGLSFTKENWSFLALFGAIVDLNGGGQSLSLEASRRLGNSFKLNLDARSFMNTEDDPQLDLFSRDDFVRVEFAYFF